jgi:uncharacterized membrane protein YsdA (DUF1294 family)
MSIQTIAAIFILINLITFIVFGVDKYLAIVKKRRISEKRLLLLATLGGSLGAILGQKIFRHKTQKFKSILWIIVTVHITTIWSLYMVINP